MVRKILLLATLLFCTPAVVGAVPAFPGAEGFGADTRGAYALYLSTLDVADLPEVLVVENTNSSGDGSFRAAIEASGPRIIVFKTGGIITHNDYLTMTNPYVTIAGQTAPGDGITLRGVSFRVFSTAGTQAKDIIIRGMRFRPADIRTAGWTPSSTSGQGQVGIAVGHDHFCSTCPPAKDVIVDHCSVAFSTDETITTWGQSEDITLSNNLNFLPSNGTNTDWTREGHNFGMLVGVGSKNVTVKGNVTAHASYRNPNVTGGDGPGLKAPATNVEIINNVVYNARKWGPLTIKGNIYTSGSRDQDVVISGNYHKAGANTNRSAFPYSFQTNDDSVEGGLTEVASTSVIYLSGNITPARPNHSLSDFLVCGLCDQSLLTNNPSDIPFIRSTVSELEASAAYTYLLGMDGTIPRVGAYPRDIVDTIAIEEITNGTGTWGRGPEEATTTSDWRNNRTLFPAYDPGTAWTDSDNDGMDDAWEIANCGGIVTCEPHDEFGSTGYTNIETWINSFFIDSGDDPIVYRTLTISDTSTGTGDGTITSSPIGISCGADCSGTYADGSYVKLTQEPYAGDTFIAWTGDCLGQPSSGCILTMDGNKTASATFAGQTTTLYSLTVTDTTGPGSGTITSSPAGVSCGIDCDHNYDSGTEVTLSAVADSGSMFTGWSGDCAGQTGDCILTIDANKTASAGFDLFSGGGEPGKIPYTTDTDMWTDFSGERYGVFNGTSDYFDLPSPIIPNLVDFYVALDVLFVASANYQLIYTQHSRPNFIIRSDNYVAMHLYTSALTSISLYTAILGGGSTNFALVNGETYNLRFEVEQGVEARILVDGVVRSTYDLTGVTLVAQQGRTTVGAQIEQSRYFFAGEMWNIDVNGQVFYPHPTKTSPTTAVWLDTSGNDLHGTATVADVDAHVGFDLDDFVPYYPED